MPGGVFLCANLHATRQHPPHPATVDKRMIPQQQPLITEAHTTPAEHAQEAPAPLWLQRMSLIVLVLFCLYIGVIVTILPWLPRFWDNNGWLVAHPALHELASQGWFRGLISGLGLIDIWIGISEAMHYRSRRRG